MSVLENLKPERVFHYFEEITKIPHGSGNTQQISDYLVAFAKEHGLRHVQDESGNVIIFKEAAPGYENAPAVILQGHVDMVCEKLPESTHDLRRILSHFLWRGISYMRTAPLWAEMTASPWLMSWLSCRTRNCSIRPLKLCSQWMRRLVFWARLHWTPLP